MRTRWNHTPTLLLLRRQWWWFRVVVLRLLVAAVVRLLLVGVTWRERIGGRYSWVLVLVLLGLLLGLLLLLVGIMRVVVRWESADRHHDSVDESSYTGSLVDAFVLSLCALCWRREVYAWVGSRGRAPKRGLGMASSCSATDSDDDDVLQSDNPASPRRNTLCRFTHYIHYTHTSIASRGDADILGQGRHCFDLLSPSSLPPFLPL